MQIRNIFRADRVVGPYKVQPKAPLNGEPLVQFARISSRCPCSIGLYFSSQVTKMT